MLRYLLFFLLSLLLIIPSYAETLIEDMPRDEKGWTDWVTLGGGNYSDPAACTAGNYTFVFVQNSQRQLSYRKRDLQTGRWTVWVSAPVLKSGNTGDMVMAGPTVTCHHDPNYDSLVVEVVGTNHRLWTITAMINEREEKWGEWYFDKGFNAAFFVSPVIATWAGGQTHHFVKGQDNRIYVKNRNLPFELLVAEPSTEPWGFSAVWGTKDRLDFFYCDQSKHLWQRFKIGNTWSGSSQIPLTCVSSPSVISRNATSLELFAKGNDSTVWHKRYENNVWGPWYVLGGTPFGGPGATVYANSTRMMLFSVFKGGQLYYKAWAP